MAEHMTQLATFAAGCFWGVEEAFRHIKGVKNTTVGYTGGDFQNPTYEAVCSGKTGHAEAVQIRYDPAGISYEELLKIFWNTHDPTTRNRQPARTTEVVQSGGWPDVGEQYRSAIFYHNIEQKQLAEQSKKMIEKSKRFSRPVVTEIAPASKFWPAEEYHQQYLHKAGLARCGA